jgi:hypothetical protein
MKLCPTCGAVKTEKNTSPSHMRSGYCRVCDRDKHRVTSKYKPKRIQHPEALHVFYCGCAGVLPARGKTNKLAVPCGKGFGCRIAHILRHSRAMAQERGYVPVSKDTSHQAIREMMRNENCILCQNPLLWIFKAGKTPHLHHNHETGEALGFVHNQCNTKQCWPVNCIAKNFRTSTLVPDPEILMRLGNKSVNQKIPARENRTARGSLKIQQRERL